ncbi:MAG TPA: lipocalin family protein [Phycisphaerae bacterium]|nr:lipocalin family protein [Phycisphaerae bacterium]
MIGDRIGQRSRAGVGTVNCCFLTGVVATLLLTLPGCGALQQPDYPDLQVVDYVDLDRYLGKWYEIARYPNDFEQNCVGVTADYSLRNDGQIRVVNTCRNPDGGTKKRIEGTARVDDRSSNAKLKVSFFWPFSGAYWIIDLDPDYRYAVVGEPGRKFFWILSRTPTMDDETLDGILQKMPGWLYDQDRLYYVPQFGE